MMHDNPFSNTKASHLSDDEVFRQWVDLDDKHRNHIEKLRSETPAILVGGKGCGKTHLMRFYSFPIQQMRAVNDLLLGLEKEGFIGIYARAENLNAYRFDGKGQNADVWRSVFPLYFQLWYAEILLQILQEIKGSVSELATAEGAIANEITSLMDVYEGQAFASFQQAVAYFAGVRRKLGNAVNNCGITGHLDAKVIVSPGILLRKIPKIVRKLCAPLSKMRFHYMLDEFELLLPDQQRYLHTFVREMGGGISIKIGSRLYGLKTFETFNDGEVNKEGSEYEKIELEDRSGSRGGGYSRFARELIKRRLQLSSKFSRIGSRITDAFLNELFEPPADGEYAEHRTSFVNEKNETERLYFSRLRKQLEAWRVDSASINEVIKHLSCPRFPLLEKVGILSLYKDWQKPNHITKASEFIQTQRDELIANGKVNNSLKTLIGHFKYDLIAQLYREYNRQQEYAGIECLIELSAWLPRSLLVIMRHIFEIADFRGEPSLGARPVRISRQAQREAVIKAAHWFLEDALIKGPDGIIAQRAMRNLGELFRAIRFADKPVESSLCTFSVDLLGISHEARECIRMAEEYSLLVRPPREHRDRNSDNILPKFQISPMLAPIWDLPVGRRGVIQLNQAECEAIFVSQNAEDFRRVIDCRVRRMTAPLFGKGELPEEREPELFGHE